MSSLDALDRTRESLLSRVTPPLQHWDTLCDHLKMKYERSWSLSAVFYCPLYCVLSLTYLYQPHISFPACFSLTLCYTKNIKVDTTDLHSFCHFLFPVNLHYLLSLTHSVYRVFLLVVYCNILSFNIVVKPNMTFCPVFFGGGGVGVFLNFSKQMQWYPF